MIPEIENWEMRCRHCGATSTMSDARDLLSLKHAKGCINSRINMRLTFSSEPSVTESENNAICPHCRSVEVVTCDAILIAYDGVATCCKCGKPFRVQVKPVLHFTTSKVGESVATTGTEETNSTCQT